MSKKEDSSREGNEHWSEVQQEFLSLSMEFDAELDKLPLEERKRIKEPIDRLIVETLSSEADSKDNFLRIMQLIRSNIEFLKSKGTRH